MALHLIVRELGRYSALPDSSGADQVSVPVQFSHEARRHHRLPGERRVCPASRRRDDRHLPGRHPRSVHALSRRLQARQVRPRRVRQDGAAHTGRRSFRSSRSAARRSFPILEKGRTGPGGSVTQSGPFFPITPTFPFLPPVPLPSKWHTQFLEPMHVEDRYPPEAADDPEVVSAISLRGQDAEWKRRSKEMLRRRKSIFFGSVFEAERPRSERRSGREKAAMSEQMSYKEKLS